MKCEIFEGKASKIKGAMNTFLSTLKPEDIVTITQSGNTNVNSKDFYAACNLTVIIWYKQ